MKKLLVIIALTFTFLQANATENQLTTVVLEGVESGYNIVLRSDSLAKVKKTIQSNDKIILELKGITSTNAVNTLYQNTTAVNSIIVEKAGNEDLKIYIQAPNIAGSEIIFDTPASAPVFVTETLTKEKIAWIGFVFVMLCSILASTKSLKSEPTIPVTQADIKQRELELYRNFKHEMAHLPSMNYKVKTRSSYTTDVIGNRKTIRQFQRDEQIKNKIRA